MISNCVAPAGHSLQYPNFPVIAALWQGIDHVSSTLKNTSLRVIMMTMAAMVEDYNQYNIICVSMALQPTSAININLEMV